MNRRFLVVPFLLTSMLVCGDALAQGPSPDTDDDRLGRILDYRARHLSIRGQSYLTGGSTVVVHRHHGWGWNPYWGWGTTYVIQEPVTEEYLWAVFQGQQRMSVPVYLSVTGQDEAHAELLARIRSHRHAGYALLTVGGVGLVTMMTGVGGMHFAQSHAEFHGWGIMAGSGLITLLVGLIGGSASLAESQQLRWDFTGRFDPGECQRDVDVYNRALRGDLGLSEADVSSYVRRPRRR